MDYSRDISPILTGTSRLCFLHHRIAEILGTQEGAVLFIYGLSLSLSVGAVVVLMASPLTAWLLIGQALSIFLIVTILERKGRR